MENEASLPQTAAPGKTVGGFSKFLTADFSPPFHPP
jgi:hypothetical protein